MPFSQIQTFYDISDAIRSACAIDVEHALGRENGRLRLTMKLIELHFQKTPSHSAFQADFAHHWEIVDHFPLEEGYLAVP